MELVTADEIEECKCEDIDVAGENPKSLFTLAYNLGKKCNELGGAGLSAPQVGIFKKMVVFRDKRNRLLFAINPQYYSKGSRTQTIEGCLSYPDEKYRMKRHKKIRAIYWTFDQDKKLKKVEESLTSESAFAFQHETDHINGITIAMKGRKVNDD